MFTEKITLNSMTLAGDLDTKLAAAKRAGFTAISVWEKDFREYPQGAQAARAEIVQQGFFVPEFFALREWQLLAGPARDEAFQRAAGFLAFMAGLGYDTAIVCTALGPGTVEAAAAELARVAEMAAAHGIRIAYEFVAWAEWLHDINSTWEVIQRVDRPDVGLLVDSYHLFKAGSTLADLRRIPMDRIFAVHLADAPAGSMDLVEMRRHYSLFPGDGVLPIREMIAVLRECRYTGWYGLELLSDEYWRRDPYELAEQSMESLVRIFG